MLLEIPKKFAPLFSPAYWLKILRGGRGTGKSRSWASALILRIRKKKHFVLCTREIQKSIRDSSKRLIEKEIDRQGLRHLFKITHTQITYRPNGTEIVFHGLRTNIENLQSFEGVTICIIEEARKVSNDSLEVLLPTIRDDDAEIWAIYNPKFDDDPIHVMAENPPPGTIVIDTTYKDNKFFPEMLRRQMLWMRKNDYDRYLHIWLGKTIVHSEAQVFFGKWEVQDFETPDDIEEFYFGADWGFGPDPSVLVRFFIDWEINYLYIDYEAFGYGKEISDLPDMYDEIPKSRDYLIRADDSRPELIRYMNSEGFTVVGAKKGPGSIEAGVDWMKNFGRIIIHERCEGIAYEMANYKYKENSKTGEILPIIADKHNHGIDSIRYGGRELQDQSSDWDTEVRTA